MTDRRSLLLGLATLPAVHLPAASVPVTMPDPTFALIEAHKAAFAAWGVALDITDGNGAEVESDAEDAARLALLTPEPTTLAGLRALAEHMAAHEASTGDWESACHALATIAEACRKLLPLRGQP